MSGKRSIVRFALSAIVTAACAGCFQLTDPFPPAERRLLVHAVLEVGAPIHVVTVDRTADGGDFPEPVDAQVSLILPDGTDVVFAKANTGTYYTMPVAPSTALVPGATYTLRVETVSGEVVTGTTTIPSSASAPPDTVAYLPFDMTRDTLRLTWPRVPGARSYHISIIARERFGAPGSGVRYDTRYSTFTDTTIALPGSFRSVEEGNVFLPGDSLAVVVSAVDDNFYTYYHGSLDPFAGAPPSRLNGAVGVFGSIVPLINRRYRVILPPN